MTRQLSGSLGSLLLLAVLTGGTGAVLYLTTHDLYFALAAAALVLVVSSLLIEHNESQPATRPALIERAQRIASGDLTSQPLVEVAAEDALALAVLLHQTHAIDATPCRWQRGRVLLRLRPSANAA